MEIKLKAQMFSLEVLFTSIILFLIFILVEKLDQQQINPHFLNKNEIIERYLHDYTYSLIKSNQIEKAIQTKNFSIIKNWQNFLGLCNSIQIYNQTKNISNLIFSYNKNCTISKENNNKIQTIFFDVMKNQTNKDFYIIEIVFYEEGK